MLIDSWNLTGHAYLPSLLFSSFGCCISTVFSYRTTSVVVPEAALKIYPYIDQVLVYLHFLVLCYYRIHNLFESRVALKPVLGGMRDLVSAIISHEQTL